MNFIKLIAPILFFSFFIGTTNADAQGTLIYRKDNLGNLVILREKDKNSSSGDIVYANDEWQKADVYLMGDSAKILDIDVKIDIVNNVVELKSAENEVKLLSIYQTQKVTFKNAIQGEVYSTQGANLSGPDGFFKLIYNGETKLFSKYALKVTPANYNATLATGSKEDVVSRTTIYFLNKEDKLIELKTKKGKLIEQLKGGDKLKSYMKEHSLSPKNEHDLMEIIKFVDLSI